MVSVNGYYRDLDIDSYIEFLNKQGLRGIDRIAVRIALALKADFRNIILYGAPADGKSTIATYTLDYIKQQYGIDWISYNVDEATTSYNLFGGFDPSALVAGERRIHYGVITKALKEKKNVLLDELNRTDFKNISKLMGFLSAPYRLVLEESGEVFEYPKWFVLFATMNIGDEGNFSLSRAFKRRFLIIKVKYTELELKEILEPLCGKDNLLLEMCLELYKFTWQLAEEKLVLFGCGVGHLINFIKALKVFQEEISDYSIALREAVDMTVKMQLVDENDIFTLQEVEKRFEQEFFRKYRAI